MSTTRQPPSCPQCAWALVLVAGPGLDVQPAPDLEILPRLGCATGMTDEQVTAYVEKKEWRCAWCDLGRRRLIRVDQCAYCGSPWRAPRAARFASGEPRIRLRCRCGCEAEWYPARGWGKTRDARLNPVFAARLQARMGDPAVCEWCGDPAFEFVNRPDGFFRRCLRCRGIHRW